MGKILVRDLDPYVLQKLGEEAKKKNMSREAYVRVILTQTAMMPDLKAMDERYENLVKEVVGRLEYQNEVLEKAVDIINNKI